MKHIGASAPHKDQLADYSLAVINSRDSDKLFFVFLFNRKKTWLDFKEIKEKTYKQNFNLKFIFLRLWLPESKLRPFCKENDKLFLDNSPLLTTKYKKELEKAYKKAKRFAKNPGPVMPDSNASHSKHDKHLH